MRRPLLAPAVALVLASLSACSSAPTKIDLPVLARYQSVDAYGPLSIELGDSLASNGDALRFVSLMESYAQETGVTLAGVDTPAGDTSLVTITRLSDVEYLANHFLNGEKVDEVELVTLSKEDARLIIDEMLLLWHPPTADNPRQPVPWFALKSTAYDVRRLSFSEYIATDTDDQLHGLRAWHTLDSRTPTFAWESFPREWDLQPGLSTDDFKNVRYEFKLISLVAYSGGFRASGQVVIEADGLSRPQYAIEQALPYCRQFMWTARATFELNGVPRHTEWSGAYPNLEKPWIARRNLPRRYTSWFPPSVYYFAVRTPRSPFAEACVYE